jgi:hypothetical protein
LRRRGSRPACGRARRPATASRATHQTGRGKTFRTALRPCRSRRTASALYYGHTGGGYTAPGWHAGSHRQGRSLRSRPKDSLCSPLTASLATQHRRSLAISAHRVRPGSVPRAGERCRQAIRSSRHQAGSDQIPEVAVMRVKIISSMRSRSPGVSHLCHRWHDTRRHHATRRGMKHSQSTPRSKVEPVFESGLAT